MMIRLSPVVLCQEDIRTFFGSSDLIEPSSGDSRWSEPPPPPGHEVGAPSAVFLCCKQAAQHRPLFERRSGAVQVQWPRCAVKYH